MKTRSLALTAQIFAAVALPFGITQATAQEFNTTVVRAIPLPHPNLALRDARAKQRAAHEEKMAIRTQPYYGSEAPGSLIVAQGEYRIYLIMPDGETTRSYPIATGRPGFELPIGATFTVGVKQVKPAWRPTPRMRRENPRLPGIIRHGQRGHPLGPRRLVFFNANGWTSYGAHGTNHPESIGKNESSGCVRLFDAHVLDLYPRVDKGAPVKIVDRMDFGQKPTVPFAFSFGVGLKIPASFQPN